PVDFGAPAEYKASARKPRRTLRFCHGHRPDSRAVGPRTRAVRILSAASDERDLAGLHENETSRELRTRDRGPACPPSSVRTGALRRCTTAAKLLARRRPRRAARFPLGRPSRARDGAPRTGRAPASWLPTPHR